MKNALTMYYKDSCSLLPFLRIPYQVYYVISYMSVDDTIEIAILLKNP